MKIGPEERESLMNLPDRHFRLAMEHEEGLTAICLADRKSIRLTEQITPEMFIDPFTQTIFEVIKDDPFASLTKVVSAARKHEVSPQRRIANWYRSPITAAPKLFPWNLHWHITELIRLHGIRVKFQKSLNYLLKHGSFAI